VYGTKLNEVSAASENRSELNELEGCCMSALVSEDEWKSETFNKNRSASVKDCEGGHYVPSSSLMEPDEP